MAPGVGDGLDAGPPTGMVPRSTPAAPGAAPAGASPGLVGANGLASGGLAGYGLASKGLLPAHPSSGGLARAAWPGGLASGGSRSAVLHSLCLLGLAPSAWTSGAWSGFSPGLARQPCPAAGEYVGGGAGPPVDGFPHGRGGGRRHTFRRRRYRRVMWGKAGAPFPGQAARPPGRPGHGRRHRWPRHGVGRGAAGTAGGMRPAARRKRRPPEGKRQITNRTAAGPAAGPRQSRACCRRAGGSPGAGAGAWAAKVGRHGWPASAPLPCRSRPRGGARAGLHLERT